MTAAAREKAAAALIETILEHGDKEYRIDTFIGAGEKGGLVFRAHDVETHVSVAVRCPGIPDRLGGLAYEQAMDSFLSEAKLLAHASETCADVETLLAYGIFSPPGRARLPFLVFEWLEGKSLEQHMLESANNRPSIGEALAILEPAARGLASVHALGVAHKDVRPRNLWLANIDGRTRMKVTQFVLASRIGGGGGGGSDGAGRAPAIDAFSPQYGAPEHFTRSYGPVGPHTDVYGLALCLVELVSGMRALEGNDADELYLSTSSLSRRPTFRALGVQMSDAVESVIARAVAVDPKRRWQNVRELWDALITAVPELTPAVPSVRPSRRDIGGDESSNQNNNNNNNNNNNAAPEISPSSVPSIWAAREQSSLSIIPSDDARLTDSSQIAAAAAPKGAASEKRDRTVIAPWMIVVVFAVIVVAVVVSRLQRAAPVHQTPATSASVAENTALPKGSASAPASSAEESAVTFRPFLTDMIRIPPGRFMMGTDKEGRPQHAVKITKPFFIDRTEVTTEMYASCIEEGSCTAGRVHTGDVIETSWGCNDIKEHPKFPVNCVDRTQADKFCTFAQKRLPTEAEWEYAARGTDNREYPWGNTPPTSCSMAIIAGLNGDCRERKGPMEVGHTPDGRSAFGALDMAGNVWEWVADGFEQYPTTEVTDPKVPINPNLNKGVIRGGSWDYSPLSAKATYRYAFQANVANISTGFRCARDAQE